MSEDRLWEEKPTVFFRPSYSVTTLNCVGSLRPSLDAPDTAGYEAAVGTVFHSLIAEWQLTDERPDHLLGQKISVEAWEVEIDEEMFLRAEECLERYAHAPGERYVEEVVDISGLTPIPDQGGTLDLGICRPGTLDIIDWKYGKGVMVYANGNTQLLCYAWGLFSRLDERFNFERIRLHIGQPRLNHFDVWEISRDDLLQFADWARERWAEAWRGRGDRTPSEKACRWCKVRLGCPARQALLEAIADESFDLSEEIVVSAEVQRGLVASKPDISLTPAAELTTERLAWIYQYRGTMESWFKEIGEELIRRGSQGEELGGLFKIVQGRAGNRTWRDTDATVQALKQLGVEDVWKYELVSPAEAEKHLHVVGVRGKLAARYLNLLTMRSPGKLALALVTDERSSILDIVDESFE